MSWFPFASSSASRSMRCYSGRRRDDLPGNKIRRNCRSFCTRILGLCLLCLLVTFNLVALIFAADVSSRQQAYDDFGHASIESHQIRTDQEQGDLDDRHQVRTGQEQHEEELCRVPSFSNEKPYPVRESGCFAEMTYSGYRPYCRFRHLRLDPTKVASVAVGGERLEEVMGQKEGDEYLSYQPGAFVSLEKLSLPDVPRGRFHYLNDVLDTMEDAGNNANELNATCSSFVPGATLLIQRYEYVNLYHTMTDWWNTWTVYRHLEADQKNTRIVFLDAHPAGNLDQVWTTLFGETYRVRKHFSSKTCFETALMVPAGYISHLMQWECTKPSLMDEFVDFVLEKFDLQSVTKIPGRVVIVDRKPYIAHPRSTMGHANDREIRNLEEVAKWIEDTMPEVTSVQILQLHNMTFKEQLLAVREAEILIANHGAGLTHLLFMDTETHVIEFGRALDFFGKLMSWKTRVSYYELPEVRFEISATYFASTLVPTLSKIYRLGNVTADSTRGIDMSIPQ
jgi:glycoprotein 2-beta-D-xylosyltransferase